MELHSEKKFALLSDQILEEAAISRDEKKWHHNSQLNANSKPEKQLRQE